MKQTLNFKQIPDHALTIVHAVRNDFFGEPTKVVRHSEKIKNREILIAILFRIWSTYCYLGSFGMKFPPFEILDFGSTSRGAHTKHILLY